MTELKKASTGSAKSALKKTSLHPDWLSLSKPFSSPGTHKA